MSGTTPAFENSSSASTSPIQSVWLMAVWSGLLFGLTVMAVSAAIYGLFMLGTKVWDPALTAGAIALSLAAMLLFAILLRTKFPI